MNQPHLNRRHFLRTLVAGVGAAVVASTSRAGTEIIYSSELDTGRLLYTFDDVPFDLPQMFDLVAVLKSNSCRAQFYFTGDGILKYPDSVRYLLDSNYPVGWHSMHHENMWDKQDRELVDDVRRWRRVMKEMCFRYEPTLARFPYGSGRPEQIKLLQEEGLVLQPTLSKGVVSYNWDVDTLDWHPFRKLSSEEILSQIESHLAAADEFELSSTPVVILLHLNLNHPNGFSSTTEDFSDDPDVLISHSMITSDINQFEAILV